MNPLVVITGLSGSGKSLAGECLEDIGYFCVDNLPVGLIPSFCELAKRGSEQLQSAALVVDARETAFLDQAPQVLAELREQRFPIDLVFFECSEAILKRRYSESRRPHPLARENITLEEAIRLERQAMEPIRQMANRIIDTSHYTSHQLKAYLKRLYGPGEEGSPLSVNVKSFGFKYGVPLEADLIFDVRFLPNPYFVQGLRPLDGRTKEVQAFLIEQPELHEFETRLRDMLDFLIPQYQREGKAYLTVCIGCTGGKHRSVAISERLGGYLGEQQIGNKVSHRDLGKE